MLFAASYGISVCDYKGVDGIRTRDGLKGRPGVAEDGECALVPSVDFPQGFAKSQELRLLDGVI